MRNELSSALRRFPLCIIHGRARAREDLLTTSCKGALQTPHAWPYVDNVRRRERGRASRRGESSDAEEATADFRVTEGIEAGRRVVLPEPAATIINGQGVTPREITSLTSASMPTGQPPAAPRSRLSPRRPLTRPRTTHFPERTFSPLAHSPRFFTDQFHSG